MDYTAVVIPITKADKSIDQATAEFKPLSEKDKRNWDACKRDCPLILRL